MSKTRTNFYKNCPECGEIQYYSTERNLNQAIKQNRKCLSCSHLGQGNNYSEYTKNFFKCIDTEEKAYVLGFIFGDGNICKGRNTVRIGIHQKDISILKKIKTVMGLKDKKLYCYSRSQSHHPQFSENYIYKSAELQFCNKQIKQDLIKHGCRPAKSLTLGPPKNLPKKLIPHFIRGLVDADGSFYTYIKKDGQRESGFKIVGTESLLKFVAKYLPINYDVKKIKNKNLYVLVTKSNQAIIDVGEYIYQSSTILLQRKKDKFEEIRQFIINRTNPSYIKIRHKATGKTFNSIQEADKVYGISSRTISRRLRDKNAKSEFEYVNINRD